MTDGSREEDDRLVDQQQGVRLRAARYALEHPSDLERELDDARAATDEEAALAALARHPVWYLGLPDAGEGLEGGDVRFGVTAAGDVVLPLTALAPDKACLLAFSSRAALVAHHGSLPGDQHVQTAAGQLLGLLPPAVPVVLNASGPRLLTLGVPALRAVARTWAAAG